MPKIVRQPVSTTRKRVSRKDVRESLNMRIRAEERKLIDHAAQITGKNRTQFVMDAARQAAQEAVLDQRFLTFSPDGYAAFLAMLDAPAKPNERLIKTMRTRPVWE